MFLATLIKALIGLIGMVTSLIFLILSLFKKERKGKLKIAGTTFLSTIAIIVIITMIEFYSYPINPKSDEEVLTAFRETPLGGIWLALYRDQSWELGHSSREITSNGTYHIVGDTITLIASKGMTVIDEVGNTSFIIEEKDLVEIENSGIRSLKITSNKLMDNPSRSSLIEKVVWRNFSSPSAKDKFSIEIVGKSIAEGTMIFTIESSEGLTIHSEEYPSNHLVGYGLLGKEATAEIVENFIKNRVNEFFDEKNFVDSPIRRDDEIDEDYSNTEVWNDIKSDSTAVGFYYMIGEEAGCWIAYSKKKRETVKYFCCC